MLGTTGGLWCANCGLDACRERAFLWMALCLAGVTVRSGLLGVTSTIRAPGSGAGLLRVACRTFSIAGPLNLSRLTRLWCALVFRIHPGILYVNGRAVLVAKRSQGCQRWSEGARSQEASLTIRVKLRAGVHLRPLRPGSRRAYPGLGQRICLAPGLPHLRRHRVF
jgi:hypothetical protein